MFPPGISLTVMNKIRPISARRFVHLFFHYTYMHIPYHWSWREWDKTRYPALPLPRWHGCWFPPPPYSVRTWNWARAVAQVQKGMYGCRGNIVSVGKGTTGERQRVLYLLQRERGNYFCRGNATCLLWTGEHSGEVRVLDLLSGGLCGAGHSGQRELLWLSVMIRVVIIIATTMATMIVRIKTIMKIQICR